MATSAAPFTIGQLRPSPASEDIAYHFFVSLQDELKSAIASDGWDLFLSKLQQYIEVRPALNYFLEQGSIQMTVEPLLTQGNYAHALKAIQIAQQSNASTARLDLYAAACFYHLNAKAEYRSSLAHLFAEDPKTVDLFKSLKDTGLLTEIFYPVWHDYHFPQA